MTADCILRKIPGRIDVITGTYNLSTVKPEDLHQACETIVHPLFFKIFKKWGFDIVLIKLKKPIELMKGKTEQACLGFFMVEYLCGELLTIGYGATNRSFIDEDYNLQVGAFSDVSRYTWTRDGNLSGGRRLVCILGTLHDDRPIYCGDISFYTRLSHVQNFITKHIGQFCY